mmetsp:Transcript_75861/g.234853  ORF Transcript_75861/g.234853 Transcript_75861/m.234853 type:complete len:339 (+) Transcript_75861:1291-2307(+)
MVRLLQDRHQLAAEVAEVVLAHGGPGAAARDVDGHVQGRRRVHRGDVVVPEGDVRFKQALAYQRALPIGVVHHLHRQRGQPLVHGLLGVPLGKPPLHLEVLSPECRHGIGVAHDVIDVEPREAPAILGHLEVVADTADAQAVRDGELGPLDGLAVRGVLDAEHELPALVLPLDLSRGVAVVVHAVGASEDVVALGDHQLGTMEALGVQGDLVPKSRGQVVGHAQGVVDEQAQHLLLVEGQRVQHSRAEPDCRYWHDGLLGVVLPGFGPSIRAAVQGGLLESLRQRHAREPVEDLARQAVDALQSLGEAAAQGGGAARHEHVATDVGLDEDAQRQSPNA